MPLKAIPFLSVPLAAAGLAMASFAAPSAQAEGAFGYACEDCPAAWPKLEIANNNCGGLKQSPIAFSRGDAKSKRRLPRIRMHYSHFVGLTKEVLDTNIEYKDETPGENFLRLDGETYTFIQFHFHSAAEHVLNGNRSPLELHFVHQSDDGDLLVLGMFIKEGRRDDAAFDSIVETIGNSDVPDKAEVDVELADLPPRKLSSFRYLGSTTTPPCTAGVQWILLKKHLKLSGDQIETIQAAIRALNDGFDNNRTVQNRETRMVRMEPQRSSRGDDDDDDHDD